MKTILNPEEHQNPINGSKVMAILLKGWISPVGGASAVEGQRSTGLPRLVLLHQHDDDTFISNFTKHELNRSSLP